MPATVRSTPGEEAPRLAENALVTCRPAVTAAELAAHHAIRHQVFVAEQKVFIGSDRDEHDKAPGVIHLLGRYGDRPAGAVRLFPLDVATGSWQGDRLCVLQPFRMHGIGAPLVRCAVASAGARGGRTMIAHIQLPNVGFFLQLGWHPQGGTEQYVGRAHQRMVISLPSPEAASRTERELFDGVRG